MSNYAADPGYFGAPGLTITALVSCAAGFWNGAAWQATPALIMTSERVINTAISRYSYGTNAIELNPSCGVLNVSYFQGTTHLSSAAVQAENVLTVAELTTQLESLGVYRVAGQNCGDGCDCSCNDCGC